MISNESSEPEIIILHALFMLCIYVYITIIFENETLSKNTILYDDIYTFMQYKGAISTTIPKKPYKFVCVYVSLCYMSVKRLRNI